LFSGLRDVVDPANVVGRIRESNRSIMGEAGHVSVTFGRRNDEKHERAVQYFKRH
jgi:hypothetical protein